MSINCILFLPNEAQVENVAKVMGLLFGLQGELKPLVNGYIYLDVPGVRIVPSPNELRSGTIVVEKRGFFCVINAAYGAIGDYNTRTGLYISMPFKEESRIVAKELVNFFGGQADYNDCDDVAVDFAMPTAPDLLACDGEAWDNFQKRMAAVKPPKKLINLLVKEKMLNEKER